MRISDWSSDVCSSDLHDRHRRQQRQVAVGQLDGLEGDAGQADIQQLLRQRRLGGQVQVAEQQVVLAQVLQVAGDRLLDLDDQFALRSEEHTSELQSLMRTSYAVFCLKKKNKKRDRH